jgi:Tfp pilus assembly protein PilF
MNTLPCLLVSLILIFFGSGCQHLATPSLSTQKKFFESLKAANPEEEAALRCAQYYNLIGRSDLALQELRKAVASDSHNTRLLNAMGNCYDKLGQYVKAQEMYERILTLDADNLLAKNNLGYSCYLSGDRSGAERIFQEILSKNPEYTVARNNLGLLWCRQGKESQALGLWQKTEGEIQAREKLAQVLACLGKSGNQATGSPSPKNIPPQLAQRQADQTEKESGSLSRARAATKPAILKSSVVAGAEPDRSSSGPNPENLAGKIIPKPQVKVEEVKMIIQPATYTQTTTAGAAAKDQNPLPLATPGQNGIPIPGLNQRPEAKEFVLDDNLLEDDIETPVRQQYYRRPRQWQRYPKPKMITFNPPPKKSESFKKCLSQECIYQNQKASGRQDQVF